MVAEQLRIVGLPTIAIESEIRMVREMKRSTVDALVDRFPPKLLEFYGALKDLKVDGSHTLATYEKQECAQEFKSGFNGRNMLGKKLVIEWAHPRAQTPIKLEEKEEGELQAQNKDAQSREPSPEPCSDHCLVVHGLDPKRINWRDLVDFGRSEGHEAIYARTHPTINGLGLIAYQSNSIAAAAAAALNGKVLDGKTMQVQVANRPIKGHCQGAWITDPPGHVQTKHHFKTPFPDTSGDRDVGKVDPIPSRNGKGRSRSPHFRRASRYEEYPSRERKRSGGDYSNFRDGRDPRYSRRNSPRGKRE